MIKGLREFDDSVGRCTYCDKLIFKDEDWTIPQFMVFAGQYHEKAHRACEIESTRRSCQI